MSGQLYVQETCQSVILSVSQLTSHEIQGSYAWLSGSMYVNIQVRRFHSTI